MQQPLIQQEVWGLFLKTNNKPCFTGDDASSRQTVTAEHQWWMKQFLCVYTLAVVNLPGPGILSSDFNWGFAIKISRLRPPNHDEADCTYLQ